MKKSLLLFILLGVLICAGYADTLLFNHPFTTDTACYTSAYDPSYPIDYEVAENFDGITQPISKIVVYGIISTYNAGFVQAIPAASEPFIVRFYNPAPVQPDWTAPVHTFNVNATNVPVSMLTWGDWILYKFEMSLPSDVNMAAGWFSVVMNTPAGSGVWFLWDVGTGGDLYCYQRVGAKGPANLASVSPGEPNLVRDALPYDLACELYFVPPAAGFTFEVNAYDLTWYATMGYSYPILVPPYNDPNDLNAEILFNGASFPIPIYTPYTFGGSNFPQPDYPFVAGLYSVTTAGYSSWLPVSMSFFDITTNYGGDFLGIPDEPPTPVELSGFTATLDAQNYVQLTWTSQSETNMLGYRVYRNETSLQSGATMITPILIPATNTSEQQTYTMTDSEVELEHVYYYWLECVDMNSSSFHGPMSILVEGEIPPVIPETASMGSAYPNPFKANSGTTFEVNVKAGESGTVMIYNLSGRIVRKFAVNPGTHNINWNGLDANGNPCGSGVYFYKLSTPSFNQAKKLVIVK